MASLEERIKTLTERTGYPLDIHPGQRRYGPPTDFSDSVPPKDAEVFIGKIPKDLFEDELVPKLEECGPIFDIRLMMDTESSSYNKGYAFVRMMKKDGAAQCVSKLDKFAIRPGKQLGVCISQSNSRLFVAGIPKNKCKDEIFKEFTNACKGVVDVVFYADPKDLNRNRGFCFIDFDSHGNASTCRKRITSGRFSIWNKTNLVCEWAIPQEEPDEDVMGKVKTLFVKHIADSVQQKDLDDLFNNYGQVEKINRIKDYAFVFFMERESALSAIESTDGYNLKGSHLSVSLAKPAAKQKDMIPRGGYKHGSGNEGYSKQFGQWDDSEYDAGQYDEGSTFHDEWHGPSEFNDNFGGPPMVSYPLPQSSTGPMWRGRGTSVNKRGGGGNFGNRGGNNERRGSFGGNNDRRGSFGGNNDRRGGFGTNDRRGRGGFGGSTERRGSFGGNNRRGSFGSSYDKNGGSGSNQGGGLGSNPNSSRTPSFSGYEDKRGRGSVGGTPTRGPVRSRGIGPNTGRGSGGGARGGPYPQQPGGPPQSYNQQWASSATSGGSDGYGSSDYSGYPQQQAPPRAAGYNSGRGGYETGSSWNEDYSVDSWQGQTTYGKRPPSDPSGSDSKRPHYQPPPPGGQQSQWDNSYNSGYPPSSGQWSHNPVGQGNQFQGYNQTQWK